MKPVLPSHLVQNYENETYWKDLHERFRGSLKAVGWPDLSEAFNETKYESESASFLKVLECFVLRTEPPIRVLEIGVGIGFWTGLLLKRLSRSDFLLTGLDISEDALAGVRRRFPQVDLQHIDLRTVDPDRFFHRFDLVTALMVLLHLTVPSEFDRALRFAARSVRPGGTLVLYEPAITEAYSPWVNARLSGDSSLARLCSAYDKPLEQEGLKRVAALPGATWVLNSPIEANTRFRYRLRRLSWHVLCRSVYRFEGLSARLSPLALRLDALFKRGNGAGSGKFLVYRRLTDS